MAYNEYLVDALEVMRDVADRKNDDYADDFNAYSNFEGTAHLTGLTVPQVFHVMIGIKAERIRQLVSGKDPNHESLQDSVMDLAVYAALWLSWLIKTDREAYQERVSAEYECFREGRDGLLIHSHDECAPSGTENQEEA